MNLFDVLSLLNAASQNSWFVLLLLAALVMFGWITALVFGRLRREQQAVKEIRARALLDQWNAAGAEVIGRPPSEVDRVLAEFDLAENLRRDALRLGEDADRLGLRCPSDVHDVPEEGGRD